MTDERIRGIVILGGGTAGWMTAAALAKANTPHLFDVTLIESDDIGTVGVGEATIPTIHWFNQLIGLSESELLRETQATFKLGIEFPGWREDGHTYLHPFGRYGAPQDHAMFYHRWIRQWLQGRLPDHEAFSFTAALARAGRFARPSGDQTALAATLGYAYHFDASLYARLLRRMAEAAGVRRVEGKVAHIHRDGETGFITSLETGSGERLAGDFFIDASGFRALLIGETLGVGYDDWSHWLPCDRALAVPSANAGDPVPFTRATARPAGWQWRIPLRHRTGNGMVYSSAHMTEDEASRLLLANLGGEALGAPRPLRFRAGIRDQVWHKNVLSVGLASGFLEPLESTSIHFIQSAIAKFLSLFPTKACRQVTAAQFNRVFRADMEAARDFLILHYQATHGRQEPFWRDVRAAARPDSLAFRMDNFVETGRIVLSTDELFREASWFSVLMGQGVYPTDYNPLVGAIDDSSDLRVLEATCSAITEATRRAETHSAALVRAMR